MDASDLVSDEGRENTDVDLGQILSAGAAADVFHVSSDLKLVKKILRLSPRHFNDSEKEKGRDILSEYRKRFAERTLMWSRLVHPNIAPLSSPCSTTLSFRQEYCGHGDLCKYVRHGPGPRFVCFSIIGGILSGLAYLHNHDPIIAHGNLKASKIFVTLDGTVKIGEFGLAESMARFSRRVPTVSFGGLVRWTSPERLQLQAEEYEETASTESDIWSLGCTLFEVLTGRLPYSKYKYDPKVAQRIMAGEPPGDLEQVILPTHPTSSDSVEAAPDCTDFLRELISMCWATPLRRTSSKDLLQQHKSSKHTSASPNSQAEFTPKTISASPRYYSVGGGPTFSLRRHNPLFREAGCHRCRTRTFKCDARKPYCTRCIEQGTTDECQYDEIRKSKLTLQQKENAVLKKRIAHLERRLAASRSGQLNPMHDGKVFLTDPAQMQVDENSEDGQDGEDSQEYRDASYAPAQPSVHTGPYHPAEPYIVPQATRMGMSNLESQPLAPSWSIESGLSAAETHMLPEGQAENLSQAFPYLDLNTSHGSPGSTNLFRGSANYPQEADFSSYGIYQRGRMDSYDAHLGAPSLNVSVSVRNRPMPSSVVGGDITMNFFQHWKNELAGTYHAHTKFMHSAIAYSENIPGSGSALVGNWWEADDLPNHQRDYLLERFLPFRKQVGLEIWVPDFLASLHLPPKGRPHPGLMWMIYTFAAHFSGDSDLESLVPKLLEKARRCLRRGHSNGDRLLNCIQGMTLLATMLHLQGKINEGKLEGSYACHVAMACGLHKISSSDWLRPVLPPGRSQLHNQQIDYHLAHPGSAREHGERIAAFWQLVLVDYTAAVAGGLPPNFRDDEEQYSRVETVFPRPLEDYINDKASGVPYATLGDIFAPRFVPTNPPDIVTTLQVKATALLERAVRLGTIWHHGVDSSSKDPDKYRAEYNIVYTAIRHFRIYLPPIRQYPTETQLPCTISGLVWERLYPHFITLNAEIQLCYVPGHTDPLAYDRCLDSARTVKSLVSELTDSEILQAGTIFKHCFTSALRVLSLELEAKKALCDHAGVELANHEQEIVLNALKVLEKEYRF